MKTPTARQKASRFIAETMAEGIARVFSNENGALKMLEAEVGWEAYQSLLGTNNDEIDKTLGIILEWLGLVDQLGATDLPEGARDWFETVKQEKDITKRHCRILEEMATRHRANWVAAQSPSDAYTSFRFAYRAQRDRERHDPDTPNATAPEETALETAAPEERAAAILKVAGDLTKTSRGQAGTSGQLIATTANIAIAMALRYDKLYQPALEEALKGAKIIEGPDKHSQKVFDTFKNAHNKAMKAQEGELKFNIIDYEKSLRNVMKNRNSDTAGKEKARLRFDVYNRIGRICYGKSEDETDIAIEDGAPSLPPMSWKIKGHLQAAQVAFVTALETTPSVTPQMVTEGRNIIRTYWLKAKVETILGDHERALESIEKAVATATKFEQETTTVFFDELVCRLSGNQGGSKNVLRLLEHVGHTQLMKGFMAETHRRIHRAAKREGRTDAQRVYKSYEKAVSHLIEEKDAAAQMLSIWWADFVRFVWAEFEADARKETEQILRRALNVKVVGDIDTTIRIGWRLSDLFLEQFLHPAAKQRVPVDQKDTLVKKQEALDKMEDLMLQLKGLQSEFECSQSQMSIPLSIMRRKLSPALTFFEGADETFRGCIKALTDERQDNDAPSFQVLAKVLCLVPGLEKHAEIAASCHFYIIHEKLFTGRTQSFMTCSYCEKQVAADVETEAVYLCCYCTYTVECKSCHDNNQPARNCTMETTCTSKSRSKEADTIMLQAPCCPNHMYITARGDRWGGVTMDGKMSLKGESEEELSFTEWLLELERAWESAWRKFWGEPTL